MPRVLLRGSLLVLLLPACGGSPPDPVAARLDLRAALGVADAHPVGVAVDATGAITFLDAEHGLYRLHAGTHAIRVHTIAELPTPDVPVRPPFTDLVALGDDRFAVTAIGDGYLLDLGAASLRQYFCYEPGGFPEEQEQRTGAVTFDPTAQRLYAQPRTFDLDGNLLRSEVAAYDAATGADVAWRSLPADLDAGGMIATADNALVLGAGSRLHRYDLGTYQLTAIDDLARYGVGHIDGLAHDAISDQLVIIDSELDELIAIANADLMP